MKPFLVLFFSFCSFLCFGQLPHCGFDFTSYLVVHPHEEEKPTATNLSIQITDESGAIVLNTNNVHSWKNANKPLYFTLNYRINKENEPEKWFFPYAKEVYLLSVVADFPAENYFIKITDPSGRYKEQVIALQAYNLYILCASENEKKVRTFGPRTNKPIEVILEKK